MAKGDDGCLKALLIGCGGLLVLALAAGAFGYYRVVRPMQERVVRVGEMQEESVELQARLEELNTTYAYEPPEDPAEVVLDEEDVERYVAVRSALSDEVVDILEAGRIVGEGPEPEDVGLSEIGGMFSNMFGSFEATAESRLALQREALEALEAQRMSPRELRSLLALVEWRFLGRSSAAFLGLPSDERGLVLDHMARLRDARRALALAERYNAEIDGETAEELRADVERIETQISVLEDRAGTSRELHPETSELLEEHRADLEGLAARGLDLLATLTEQEVEEPPQEATTGG